MRTGLLALLVATSLTVHGSQIVPRPLPPEEPTFEDEPTFEEGLEEGVAIGEAEGFAEGFDAGTAACLADPISCGVTIGAAIPPAEAGETEPNNNLFTADPLILGSKFWGQSYAANDQDWFFLITSAPNQTLILSFSVPDGPIDGWAVSVRDAGGNVLARFETGALGGNGPDTPAEEDPDAPAEGEDAEEDTITVDAGADDTEAADITYRMTLGLAGTYYVVIEPTTLSFYSYNLAAVLQQSPLTSGQPIAGFFDTEVEPNDRLETATPIASTVPMYGVINLSFVPGTVVPSGDGNTFIVRNDSAETPIGADAYIYSQNEDIDWYRYETFTNENIELAICEFAECTQGSWLFELFTQTGAEDRMAGNTLGDAGDEPPVLAINSDNGNPDSYYAGLMGPAAYYLRVSHTRLLTAACTAYRKDDNGDGVADDGGEACACGPFEYSCEIEEPGESMTNEEEEEEEEEGEEAEGADENAAVEESNEAVTISCLCTEWDGAVFGAPENAVTPQYNFTVKGSFLPPNTATTDAYDEALGRPNPYLP
ncbi:MAG: hypothetical protein K9L32_00075 [Chromatiaceae bacterium]|nr:hypothetical protein [Chromatiaceae bacterium]